MTSIQEKIIKPKLGLLELAKQLGSVSQACNVMGYPRLSSGPQSKIQFSQFGFGAN